MDFIDLRYQYCLKVSMWSKFQMSLLVTWRETFFLLALLEIFDKTSSLVFTPLKYSSFLWFIFSLSQDQLNKIWVNS